METRIPIEQFFRLPDPGVQGLLGLSRGQLLSAAMVAAGLLLLAVLRALRSRRATLPLGGWWKQEVPHS